MIDYFDKEKIEQCFPEATMIPPMLVFSIPKHKKNILKEICDNGKYFLQLKKDGYCFTFNKTENHSYLFSRNVSKGNGLLCEKIGCVPHIEKALSNLPTNTVLVGEIYYPNGTSKDTTTIMGCLPKTAIDRQKTRGLIHYYIHDIIMFNGKNIMDKGAEKRYEILKILFESFKLYEYDFLELAAAHTENLYDKVGEALARGEEGVVLKLKTGTYEPTKRPAWNQIKVKKQDSADVICLGFEDPTKYYTGKEIEQWTYWERLSDSAIVLGNFYGQEGYKAITKPYYYGWKTAIVIGAIDNKGEIYKIGTVSSGLTDELKNDFAKNPDKYLGQVVEIQFMERDKKGKSFRHPFLIRFRDDKSKEDCLLKDLF